MPQSKTVTLATANTSRTGATGAVEILYEADGPQYVDRIEYTPLGTNIATVARIFLNFAEPFTEATNNGLLAEVTLPATTGSEVASLEPVSLDIDQYMERGNKLIASVGTTIASGVSVKAIVSNRYGDFNV
jgi:hypothetical protein